jgi:2-C-methyl-D-erythritol 4-phosphate cytidylyltransferase
MMPHPDPYADLPDDDRDLPDLGPVLGTVVEADRGALPFALIHGEALVACAAWALGDTGVTLLDHGTPWSSVVSAGEPLVLHDPLCPMTPAAFISHCVQTALERGAVVVAVRPVTDTVKTVTGEGDAPVVGATVDRAGLVTVTSPIVLPADVVAALDGPPATDFAVLAGQLAERFPVLTVEAPPAGRRVGSPDDVRLLEALTARERWPGSA